MGVNGDPELTRTIADSSNPGLIGHITVPVIEWRRSWSLLPHSTRRGSPATAAPPNPCPAPSASSRDRVYVYDAFTWNSLRVTKPLTPSVSCRVSDRSREDISFTTPKVSSTREYRSETAPVAASILLDGTYTGRPPSALSVNCGDLRRLRSTVPI